ncbi:hypothetical protein Kpho02_50160 [Kitasatospora phosalacinea]|uniref:Uncharacterized protein n=1 Tax=Kitasatospora phosalacinea TaxID=2065 RepID=A0A9W6QDU7_9ACTN|nr:hypothetical protein Kpho02_50160 [Kitasatospora phosalacinea]
MSTVTVPAPAQSGAATVQSPVRALPFWSSKPEQTTAPEQPVPPPPVELALGLGLELGLELDEGLADGLGDADGLGEALAVGEDVGVGVGVEPPWQEAPLKAKSPGAGLLPDQVPCIPKDTEPPLPTVPL